MPIQVTIERVESTREYDGIVYSQRVVATLFDRTTIGLFDPNTAVTREMIGTEQRLQIGVLVDEITRVDELRESVKPSSDDPTSWHGHTYSGTLTQTETIEDATELHLDFGVGDLTVSLRRSPSDLTVGDTVELRAQRSDIKQVL
ncbi:hypothetical protein C475_08641 [Halosimplex carlsbadense 2-9-1]|uniref:Uncharacterized protein n=1 Tax=Halosimplex carlsbadense 2-9-1 TaxID=797114 RepID=M0CYP1_9EURY|nr:hypothetical protein [Halosimplex carlsbadense]ELZ26989.1 hypothetical protein C475_08641 [Halosimplex carlsbadense 2-9-1]